MPRRLITPYLACPHFGWKITLAVLSSIIAGSVLRWLIGITASLAADGAWAQAMVIGAQEVIALSMVDFGLAVGIGSLGGFASLMSELRRDWSKFALMSGIGHMATAQFAALIAYLLAASNAIALPLALAGAGLAGWGGNVFLVWASRGIGRMIGLDVPVDPPKDGQP